MSKKDNWDIHKLPIETKILMGVMVSTLLTSIIGLVVMIWSPSPFLFKLIVSCIIVSVFLRWMVRGAIFDSDDNVYKKYREDE